MAYRTADDVVAECDLEAMRSLWAEDETICMHPGGMPLFGWKLCADI